MTQPTQQHRPQEDRFSILELSPSKAAHDSKIRDIVSEHLEQFFMGFWQIGHRARQALSKLNQKNQFSGVTEDSLFEQFAAESGVDERTLDTCIKVAGTFTKAEFRAQFIRPEMSWAHFGLVCSAETPAECQELIELTCTNHWSPNQLDAEVERRRRLRYPLPPRQARRPRNIKIALTRLQKQTERFLRDTNQMFSSFYNIPREIPWTSPCDLTEETRDQMVRTIELLDAVARDAQAHADDLQGGLPAIERVLQLRSAPAGSYGVIEETES